MKDASSRNNVIDPSTQNSLSLAHLTRDELIELIQNGINEPPKFVTLVSTAISNAHNREYLASIKPLPWVNYDQRRRKFRRKLHSLDHSNDYQQEDIWELHSDLEGIIKGVERSVNKASDLETIETAFICLKKMADEMPMALRKLYEELTYNQGHIYDDISHSMVQVGTLLREKGGPKGKGIEKIETAIELWAHGVEFNGAQYLFPQVLEAVWGEIEEAKTSNGNLEEDGLVSHNGAENAGGKKRGHEGAGSKARQSKLRSKFEAFRIR
jgi:hypothetical protein